MTRLRSIPRTFPPTSDDTMSCRPLPPAPVFAGLRGAAERRTEARMVPFFVQIKCQLGKSYEVANKLTDAELASEIYPTAGDYDLLEMFQKNVNYGRHQYGYHIHVG